MRSTDYQNTAVTEDTSKQSIADRLSAELETEGIVVLPRLLSDEQLLGMQRAFDTKLRRMRWNNFDGYQKTELYRHMVEDVLLLDQGFVDLAIHPLVKDILNRYLGTTYALTEAKGWKSLPTKMDFHGWHGDAWYNQETVEDIPRELKLAFYLTDVRSGAFNYVRGSQRRQHPRPVRNREVDGFPTSQILEVAGPAGSAFLFDTSGVHRQGVPMLEPRRAVFYNYHDPSVPLQKEDLDYYRYHPLLLNAAFLGELTAEDHRILGFGNKMNFLPAFERGNRPPALHNIFGTALNVQLRVSNLRERIVAKLRHVLGRN